ncbi:MAG: hypothetical protein ABMA13_15915 [Chthoniobacteraceae bacterium]
MKTICLLLALGTAAHACDLCGTTLIQHAPDSGTGFTLGASEQFTRFRTLQDSGHRIDNDADQKLDSSITQIFLGYHITPRLSVQVNVPLIRKTFHRGTETGGIENGRVQGLGDVSLMANWMALDHHAGDFTFHLSVNAGVKFPTGDSDRVKEEAAEGHGHGAEAPEPADAHADEVAEDGHATRGPRHGGVAHAAQGHVEAAADAGEAPETPEPLPHGIHGHDLALGTGSLDGLIGGSVHARWKRIFFNGEVQYAIRGDGEHNYDFANDLLWSGGPGVTLIERDTHTLSVQLVCSGETKGEDEFRGRRAADTATTQVFLGPKISGTWRERFAAEVGLEVPIHRDNSGVQIMPDYRLRAAMSWSF